MRKKLFAILMSAMMMVTFMPSMAFATEANSYTNPVNLPFGSVVSVNADAYNGSHYSASSNAKVVAGTCAHPDQYYKYTCTCGDYKVGKVEVSKETYHQKNMVTEEMSFEDAKALVSSSAKHWLYQLVTGKTEVEDIESFINYVLGIGSVETKAAEEFKANVQKAWKAFNDGTVQPVDRTVSADAEAELFQKLVATVLTSVNGYMYELCGITDGYVASQTQAGKASSGASAKYCKFIVTYCKECGTVAAARGIKHVKPAGVADCATSFKCATCGKTIYIKTSHFQDDALNLIGQAKEVMEDVSADADKKVTLQDLSVLANKLFFMDSTGHKLSVTTETKDCGKVYTVACSKCGESFSITMPTAVKHNFEWETLVPAYCDGATKGLKIQKCTDCGAYNLASLTVVNPKHSYVEQTFAPTCTLPGFTVKVCANCNQVLPVTSKAFTAPTRHDYEIKMIVEPKCGSNGLLMVSCKNCNRVDYYTADNFDAAAVNVSSLGAIGATAKKALLGNGIVKVKDLLHSETYGYEVAKYYFVGYDLDLLKNPIELTSPAGGNHVWGDWGIASAATCESGTVWAPKCTVCGKVASTKHKTENNTGVKQFFYEANDATGHTPVTVNVPASCGDCAYSYTYCSVCHAYLNSTTGKAVKNATAQTEGVRVNAKGSTPLVAKDVACTPADEWTTTVEPTFINEGTRVKKCTVCGGTCKTDDICPITLGKAYQPKLTAGSKKITVKITKKNKYADGYQIAYKVKGANNYKFVKITGAKKVIKSLKSGKKYAVKVRPFHKEGGKTFYGKYSTVKYVTVK